MIYYYKVQKLHSDKTWSFEFLVRHNNDVSNLVIRLNHGEMLIWLISGGVILGAGMLERVELTLLTASHVPHIIHVNQF